jgi:hypothetical protein
LENKNIEGNAVAADVLNGKTFSTADGIHTGIRPPAPIGTDYIGMGVHPPDPRFEVYTYNSVEQWGYGVKDLMTGLIWMKSPGSSTSTWSDAVDSCENLITTFPVRSGYMFVSDWRLPTVREMNSLLDYGQGAVHLSGANALVVPNFFTDVINERYWTDSGAMTPCPPEGNRCNIVYFVNIDVADVDRDLIDPTASNPPEHYHWCARGPYGIEY